MANVLFIPPQMGPITKYAGRYIRSGPLWLMFKDLCILITVLPYLPLMFFPMGTTDKREKGLRFQSIRDSVIQLVLSVLELVLSILFLPALVSLPGILFLALAIACILLIGLLAWPTQGSRVVEATIDERTLRRSQQHPGERWVFVNGVCTGSSGLQQNIDRLSLLFGRKVLGIHNQSYGLISDLLECIVQRCLSYSTEDVRVACEVLRGYLVDEEVKKVVLVAHSQGGIILSMVVDYLLAELSGEMMGKLVRLISRFLSFSLDTFKETGLITTRRKSTLSAPQPPNSTTLLEQAPLNRPLPSYTSNTTPTSMTWSLAGAFSTPSDPSSPTATPAKSLSVQARRGICSWSTTWIPSSRYLGIRAKKGPQRARGPGV